MKKTAFNFMTYYDVSVMLCREGEDILRGMGSEYPMPHVLAESIRRESSTGRTYFIIAFNEARVPTAELVAHECFHMLFQILEYQDEHPLTMTELTREIYAMAYETLFSRTLEALEKLGAFKEDKNA